MSAKTKMILWYAGLVVVFGSASFAAFHFGHSPLGILMVIVPVALVTNGFLAEREDDAPGGFNNPSTKPSDRVTKKDQTADQVSHSERP